MVMETESGRTSRGGGVSRLMLTNESTKVLIYRTVRAKSLRNELTKCVISCLWWREGVESSILSLLILLYYRPNSGKFDLIRFNQIIYPYPVRDRGSEDSVFGSCVWWAIKMVLWLENQFIFTNQLVGVALLGLKTREGTDSDTLFCWLLMTDLTMMCPRYKNFCWW